MRMHAAKSDPSKHLQTADGPHPLRDHRGGRADGLAGNEGERVFFRSGHTSPAALALPFPRRSPQRAVRIVPEALGHASLFSTRDVISPKPVGTYCEQETKPHERSAECLIWAEYLEEQPQTAHRRQNCCEDEPNGSTHRNRSCSSFFHYTPARRAFSFTKQRVARRRGRGVDSARIPAAYPPDRAGHAARAQRATRR